LLAVCAAVLCVIVPTFAHAATSTQRIPPKPELGPAASTSGDPRVALVPIKFPPQAAKPGTELRFPLRVTNTTDHAVVLQAIAIPIQGSTVPDRFAEPGSADSRSADAVAWVGFPGFDRQLQLEPGQQVLFPASVRIPRDARPGTYSLGIGVSQRISAPATNVADAPSTQVRLRAILPSVVILRVPGEVESDVRLSHLQAPRLVWSGQHPTFSVRVKNVGDTDLRIDGKVGLSSFLSSAGRTLNAKGPEKGFETLPGGTRELKMRWADPPLLGWFRPELVVVGGKGSGVRVTDNLDTVFVLPPWWLLVLLALAIWLPIRARRKRRGDEGWNERRLARARERVEGRMRKQEAMRRAQDARRGGRR
jgi:hypothetical protein